MKYYLGLELGGTNLRYGLVTEAMEVVYFEKMPSAKLAQAEHKSAFLADIVLNLMDKVGQDKILAVSMALSSLLNKERNYVYSSPMVKGFDHIPLKADLQKRIQVPIFLEKDVNILLLYELYRLNTSPRGIGMGIFLGTGLGNAMCIDGRVYPGYTGSACELGHIPLAGFEEMCGCGKRGCIELKASGYLLHDLAKEKFHCPVEEIFTLHGESEEVQSVLYHYALAIATEVGILDPSVCILGGGVSEMKDFPLSFLTQKIQENLRSPEPRNTFVIHLASGDPEAGVIGAAMHARSILAEQRK